MSFVSRLRMANMFPIKSDLGNAKIDVPEDNYDEIINQLLTQQRNSGGSNDGMVEQRMRPSAQPKPQLQFGGVVGHDSNPGADILRRASGNAERIYQDYKRPLNQEYNRDDTPDEINLEDYFNRKNKETVANSNANIARGRLDIAQQNADAKGWKTVTITDPNDPTKQINVRHNDVTGEVQPIEMPNNGIITRTGSAGDLQKTKEAEAAKNARRESITSKAQQALDELSSLLDAKTDKLTPRGARTSGLSSYGNFIPATEGYAGSKAAQRLKNLLTLDLLGEMKNQSKTGATGFGQMNMKELGVLEGAASKLDSTGLADEEYEKELQRVKKILNRVMMDPTETTKTETKTNNTTAPAAPEGYEYVRRPDNKGWTAVKKLGGK